MYVLVKVKCLKYLQTIFYDSTLTQFFHLTVIFSPKFVNNSPIPAASTLESFFLLTPSNQDFSDIKWFPWQPNTNTRACVFHFIFIHFPFPVQILTFCRRLPASLLPPACPTHGGQINFPKIQFRSVAQVLLERSVGLGRSRFNTGGQVGVGEEDWIRGAWKGSRGKSSGPCKANQKSLQKKKKKSKLWLRKSQKKPVPNVRAEGLHWGEIHEGKEGWRTGTRNIYWMWPK